MNQISNKRREIEKLKTISEENSESISDYQHVPMTSLSHSHTNTITSNSNTFSRNIPFSNHNTISSIPNPFTPIQIVQPQAQIIAFQVEIPANCILLKTKTMSGVDRYIVQCRLCNSVSTHV